MKSRAAHAAASPEVFLEPLDRGQRRGPSRPGRGPQ